MRLQSAGVWFVAGVVLAAAVTVSGQQANPTRNEDVLSALLVEVRGLRGAMEQMASAGPRVQLFVGRLQLQEARINGMIRRLDTVRDSLASAQQAMGRMQERQREIEVALAERRASSRASARAEAEDAAQMLDMAKRETAAAKAQVDRFTAEEAQLVQDITAEQSRWTDINQRLDELERALGKR